MAVNLVQDAELDHEFGAAHGSGGQTFFGGLQDKPKTAGQVFPELGEQFGGAQGDGQVKIVAAGMHDAGVLGGPGFVRRFRDGQGVHIGPPGNGGAGPGADEVGDDAVAGDAGLHCQTQSRPDNRRLPGRCAPPGWKVRDAGENPGGDAGAPGTRPRRAGRSGQAGTCCGLAYNCSIAGFDIKGSLYHGNESGKNKMARGKNLGKKNREKGRDK